MPIGERLRGERERLGMSQPKFAAIADTTKQTLFAWESGKTAPDGFQLEALARAGVDVLYVLTGDRDPEALDSSERLLLDRYRVCAETARQHLLQTAVLLASGLAPPTAPPGGNVQASGHGSMAAGRDLSVAAKPRAPRKPG